tara:strand:- start:6755 stop:7108 length:354 start_codon:yes stop_codon:yes gene_type:complete
MKIYCIEDINDLRYIGSTTQLLRQRLSKHRSDQKTGRTCSSRELNLHNAIIYILEECSEDLRLEREKYWINKIDCVNQRKLNGRNKQRISENKKRYYLENKEEINRKKREKRLNQSQ